jgi:thiol:disulfide interchange protein DsbC
MWSPYCHKLHEELAELNEQGITVRYMAFPRKGISTPAYKTMVSVWCSKDRNEAFEEAMDGDELDELQCANPVSAQYELGRQIGVQGTPTILFDSGRLVTGYKTADEIVKLAGLPSAVDN